MLSVSHGLTGAFIATKLTHPLLFIPLILASHYLQDWIPHWDAGTGLSTGRRKKSTAILLELNDLVLMTVAVYAFWYQDGSSTLLLAAIGAFIGLLPDFVEAPRNFLKWEPFFLKPFNQFHNLFHNSTRNMVLGLLPQIFVVILVYFLK
ncbi:MAG: hypothetical protein M3Q81_00785 [bacterium]|nr:hypothetical protein [bacterium]